MDQVATPAAPATDEEQLLLAMADGSYLVAAGDGLVRECGSDLAARVGLTPQDAVGRPLAELLQLGAGAEGLARALAGPDREVAVALAPPAPPARARVVPVPLSLGWEVTTLLGDVSVRDPETWTAASLHAQHGAAIDVVLDRGVSEAGARLAGILVVVRPPGGQLLDRAGVALRRGDRAAAEAARAAASAQVKAEAEAGLQSAGGLPSAAAAAAGITLDELVEDARELRRRLDESEADAVAARAAAEEAVAALAEAERLRAALEAELAMAREVAQDTAVALAEVERARAGLGAELEAARGGAGAVTAELHDARAAVAAAAVERSRLEDELKSARADAGANAGGVAAAREETLRVTAQLAEAERARAALDAELLDTRGQAVAARAAAGELHDELSAVRDALELAVAEAAHLRLERDAAIAERDAAATERDGLAEEAAHVRSVATSLRSELGVQRVPDPVEPEPEPEPEPATASAPDGVPVVDDRPPLPSAPGRAFAIVAANGCFERLDDTFSSLLGYQEHELLGAGWPSIIDADNAREHRELARQLRAGERDEADVQTFYMHARGLLVGIDALVTRFQEGGDDRLLLAVRVDGA